MKNIYMKSLRLGFKNSSNGISFNEIVKKLNIDLSNKIFELNYTVWFYSNFYNKNVEKICQLNNNSIKYIIDYQNIDTIKQHNNNKSFIKGDSINKYIDYIELRDARISSRKATRLAIISIIIASLSVIASFVPRKDTIPPRKIEVTNNWYSTTQSEFQDSTCCKFAQ